jgi:hypothetical protein
MWHRTFLFAAAATALVAACHHDNGRAATTTVRSGTMTTSAQAPVPSINESLAPADRLTVAICEHDRNCAARRGVAMSEAILRRGETCANTIRPTVEITLAAVDCPPALFEAGFKDCLAAVATSDCNQAEPVPLACRPSMICRR